MKLDVRQSEFFREVSNWFVQHVVDAWHARLELQEITGTYATMTYGDDSEEACTNVIVDACRARLKQMRATKPRAGDHHDWEWRHWFEAMSLARATTEEVDAVLMHARQEQRTGHRPRHRALALAGRTSQPNRSVGCDSRTGEATT